MAERDLSLVVEPVRVLPDVAAGQGGQEGAGYKFHDINSRHVDGSSNDPGKRTNHVMKGLKTEGEEAVDREHPDEGIPHQTESTGLDDA